MTNQTKIINLINETRTLPLRYIQDVLSDYRDAFNNSLKEGRSVRVFFNEDDHLAVMATGLLKAYIGIVSSSPLVLTQVPVYKGSLAKAIDDDAAELTVILGLPFDLGVVRQLEGKTKSLFWIATTTEHKYISSNEVVECGFFYPLLRSYSEWQMIDETLINEAASIDERFTRDIALLSNTDIFSPVSAFMHGDQNTKEHVNACYFTEHLEHKELYIRRMTTQPDWHSLMREIMDSYERAVQTPQVCRDYQHSTIYLSQLKRSVSTLHVSRHLLSKPHRIAVALGGGFSPSVFLDIALEYVIHASLNTERGIRVTVIPSRWADVTIFDNYFDVVRHRGISRFDVSFSVFHSLLSNTFYVM